MLHRLTAARATQYTSRACALCGVLLRHIFLRPKKRYAFFFIGRKKTSYTTKRYAKYHPKLVGKYLQKMIKNVHFQFLIYHK
jgi:hypothetical protein